MGKTVKEHLDASDQVAKQIKSADALVIRLKGELSAARATLDILSEYQHPKIRLEIPYHLRCDKNRDTKSCSPRDVIEVQIDRINELLGDRV